MRIHWPEFRFPPINLWSMPKLKTSEEVLIHFRCGCCDHWWTIGDAPVKEKKEWFCPWCGTKQKF